MFLPIELLLRRALREHGHVVPYRAIPEVVHLGSDHLLDLCRVFRRVLLLQDARDLTDHLLGVEVVSHAPDPRSPR